MLADAIVLAVQPLYARKIFAGTKTAELRRICPRRISDGSLVLIYVCSPVQSLSGAFLVERVIQDSLDSLWIQVKDRAGVTHEEFEAYYKGVSTGVAIFFNKVWRLPEPIRLQDLRNELKGFHPPQSFRYATENELSSSKIADVLREAERIDRMSQTDRSDIDR
jgi:predicted transcriptional regulator